MMHRGQYSKKQMCRTVLAAACVALWIPAVGIFAQHTRQNGASLPATAPHNMPQAQRPSAGSIGGMQRLGNGAPVRGQITGPAHSPRNPNQGLPGTGRQLTPSTRTGTYPGQSFPHGGYTGGAQSPIQSHSGMTNPSGGYMGTQPMPGANYARPQYNDPATSRPGHLGAWLNEHSSLPVQDQERMLRSDPSFRRLPTQDQQRLVNQLHQVDQMPTDLRDRRLGRAEMLERLSPSERTQINNSSRRFAQMPSERQDIMKNAFRDLRSVPADQRQTVLNSNRYQGAFTPEERSVLSDLLKIEPYQAAQ